ncbi:MAG: hypothetical protein IPO95_07510 [Rhodanobacteraceae bacterium]|nr:hypothetical protein [Rhodanobacteraceae bacterium]
MPPIHKRAIELVEREAALAALRGDGRLAVRIGFEFAHANHFEEAGYWYLIAAENGSGVGMQHVALSVAEYDCRRAIYWLRKAIDSGDLRGQAQEANKKTLSSWEASCGE